MSKLSELVEFNPSVRLKRGEVAPFIEMAALPTNARDIPLLGVREFSGSGSKFQNGDTLFARITPCLENGKGGYVSTLGAAAAGHGSTEFIVLRARSQTDSLFVYYITREPEFRRFAEKQMSGTSGRQRVAWQSLAEYELPEIEPSQRAAIAATLGALDDKIELNRKMNATLETMARTLFGDWFVDFGPTRAKIEGREPYLSPDLWSLFPDRLNHEGKPEGWEEKSLTDFFSIIGGGTPKTSNPAFWNGSLPWFSVTDTPSPGSVFVTNTEKTITDVGLAESSARLIPKGTTIISARGTVGNLAVAGRGMTFNQSCYGLQGVGAVGDWATYLIAQNMVSQLQAMAHGSVFSTITRQTFEALKLPKPSPEVLKAFENAVSPFFDKILANVNQSRTLAQSRDLLLPRLMSGELRVADLALLGQETAA